MPIVPDTLQTLNARLFPPRGRQHMHSPISCIHLNRYKKQHQSKPYRLLSHPIVNANHRISPCVRLIRMISPRAVKSNIRRNGLGKCIHTCLVSCLKIHSCLSVCVLASHQAVLMYQLWSPFPSFTFWRNFEKWNYFMAVWLTLCMFLSYFQELMQYVSHFG